MRLEKIPDDPKTRIVWVDCEMSGLDLEKDTLLEVVAVITDADLNVLAEGESIVIHQPDYVLDAMGPWCVNQHGKSGLTQACKESKIGMDEAEKKLLNFVRKHAPESGVCPLGGNSVGSDAKFLSKYMPKFMEHLHYRIIDVSTIKELAKRWYPPSALENAPKKSGSHRALDDIRDSIAELKFYRNTLFK